MTEISLMWGGTVLGDAGPYTDDQFSDMVQHLITYSRATDGVLRSAKTGFTGELEVSTPGGATARVPTGAALVDGKLYTNSANVDFTVSGASVHWIIGLRKSWAAQTVRAFARGNYASAALALASLVQTDGVTWEIPLATVLTTAGGDVSSITDARAVIGTKTYKFFVPAYAGWDMTLASALVRDGVLGLYMLFTSQSRADGNFIVPNNFIKNLSISPMVIVEYVGAGNAYLGRMYNSGADGELYNTHASGMAYTAVPVAAGDDLMNKIVWPLDTVASVAVGDIVNMYFERYGSHVSDTANSSIYFPGWVVSYIGY